MTRRFWAATACAWMLLASAPAMAQVNFMYAGLHPVNPVAGSGFCYVSTPHAHPYAPDPNISYLFRDWNGMSHFIGDPYSFGYQGQAFPYYGHHPLAEQNSYCYLDGQHYHHFLPPAWAVSSYVVTDGRYYYNGVLPPAYYSWRTSYYRVRHTYWYLPSYRSYYLGYRRAWRTYGTPASVTYITRPPRVVFRYDRPPPARVYNVVRTRFVPTYRYNVQRPRTYNNYYRPVVRSTTTRVTPSGRVYRTTTWRRR